MKPETFRCHLVRKTNSGAIEGALETRPTSELPPGEVLIRVSYSSLNYKDALSATGKPGVVRKLPHVPGIDAAGTVVESSTDSLRPGDEVLVTGYELGVERWGGWAEYVRVPVDWVHLLPAKLSLEQSMILGTAGFTAGLCIHALLSRRVEPGAGDVAVTGATGGVGVIAVQILSKLGYPVVAVSGKEEKHPWLRELGATRVVAREEVYDTSRKPLLSSRWAGAVDTVGGTTLATLLRATLPGGCVAACGLVGGADLPLTVYPFILRGVSLAGVDSVWCPREVREEIWSLLANEWRPEQLDSLASRVSLMEIGDQVGHILAGNATGRVVVDIGR